jgi:Tfp pilus assembly protein PilX
MKKQSALKNEQGFVLVVALLALLVVTILAVLALSTSTTEVMIAGNSRIREMNLATADAAVALTEPVLRNPDMSKYTFLEDVTQETNLKNEIYCTSVMNTDTENYSVNIGGNTIDVDVDMINRADPEAGYALDEGVSSPIKKNYIINARSTSGLGAENVVGAIYYIVGYCDN